MSRHGVDVHYTAVLGEFDDLAVQPVGTIWQVAVTVANKNMVA
jgi:hypothetical protein